MPRHSFSFSEDVRKAVKKHVKRAVASIDPNRFKQESPYCAALAQELQGVAYHGPNGHVEFKSTIVNDRGRGAAERWSGADIAITAEVSDGRRAVRKAILIQAKRGSLHRLSRDRRNDLNDKIEKMQKLTKSPKVMDLPDEGDLRDPGIYNGNVIRKGDRPKRYRLADYYVQRVLTTMVGDTRPKFVDGVQDSGLTTLKVIAEKRSTS